MKLDAFASSTPQIIDALKSAVGSVGIGADAVVTTAIRGQFIEGIAVLLDVAVVIAFLWMGYRIYGKYAKTASEAESASVAMIMVCAYFVTFLVLSYWIFQGLVHVLAPDWALMQEVLDTIRYAR